MTESEGRSQDPAPGAGDGAGSLRVRDVMVPNPRTLPVDASAQDAGRLLARPDIHALLVVDGDRLAGVVTQRSLVEGVVAAGRDPRTTPLVELLEPGSAQIEADAPVEQATALFEQIESERLPVVEGGRLVGVLSRGVLQRRLAEDEPPPEPAS